MRIEVTVPGLLTDCTGGRSRFYVEADTVSQVLDALLATYPLLRFHLFNERGETRQHVLLFYNDQNLAWLDSLDIPLKEGDRFVVMQAVSGG